MCWRSNNEPIKQIADKDIKVYKFVLRDDNTLRLTSFFTHYPYEPNEFNTEIELTIIRPSNPLENWLINEGYHSYSFKGTKKFKNAYDSLFATMFYNFKSVLLIKCLIPKGSVYYENEDGEIVSSNIIVTDKIIERIC